MNIQTTKLDLIQWLISLQDPEVLKELLAFRNKRETNGHEVQFKPFTKEELIAHAIESYKEYKAGDVIDIEDLAKEYGIKL